MTTIPLRSVHVGMHIALNEQHLHPQTEAVCRHRKTIVEQIDVGWLASLVVARLLTHCPHCQAQLPLFIHLTWPLPQIV